MPAAWPAWWSRWWNSPWRQPSLVAAGAVAAVAAAGGLATQLGPWYFALKQPSWKPADLWFGPVWTTIYLLTAVAGVRAWRGCRSRDDRVRLGLALVANGVLHVLWSLIFFTWQRPDIALLQVFVLWLSTAWLAWVVQRLAPGAGRLLWPYLAWVAFAAALNGAVVRLNGPF